MPHLLNATSTQIGSHMQNIKQGSSVMTEGFQDIEGRIVNDIWSFILIKIWSNIYASPSQWVHPIASHKSAFLASFSVLNLYLKNMYVLSQMLPVPKVTLW